MKTDLKHSLFLLLTLTVVTGVLYPLAITIVAQVVFPKQAGGSFLVEEGRVVGSKLIGQNFDDPHDLWGRLSATTPSYNAAASSGSNLGPSNPLLLDQAKSRIDALKKLDPENHRPLPIDLVTASASGLDPHVSPAAAEYQVSRIARINGISEASVRHIIQNHTEDRFLGMLGEPRVNVLEVNLDLRRLYGIK